MYVFQDNAYHIANNDTNNVAAIALLPDEVLPASFAYSLGIQAVKGDENSINNQLGMIIRYSTHQQDGRTVSTFYCFDVANEKAGEYQFWKYDNTNTNVNPWTKLWSHSFGREYHFGHGAANKNTFKVSVKGNKFTFFINGKQVGANQDNALTGGQIGMLVNLQGSEAAFTNLMLMYN